MSSIILTHIGPIGGKGKAAANDPTGPAANSQPQLVRAGDRRTLTINHAGPTPAKITRFHSSKVRGSE